MKPPLVTRLAQDMSSCTRCFANVGVRCRPRLHHSRKVLALFRCLVLPLLALGWAVFIGAHQIREWPCCELVRSRQKDGVVIRGVTRNVTQNITVTAVGP